MASSKDTGGLWGLPFRSFSCPETERDNTLLSAYVLLSFQVRN
jgi:hypothetical protein